MSGTRKPMEVNLAAGGKHWTKAQIVERTASEAKVQKPEKLKCPAWLNSNAKKLFKAYARELIANLPVSSLDIGTLARMCDAEVQYAEAARLRDEAKEREDYEFWSKALASYEKIARGCANDLGCTIASRCKLVVPQTKQEEADPLAELMEGLHVV